MPGVSAVVGTVGANPDTIHLSCAGTNESFRHGAFCHVRARHVTPTDRRDRRSLLPQLVTTQSRDKRSRLSLAGVGGSLSTGAAPTGGLVQQFPQPRRRLAGHGVDPLGGGLRRLVTDLPQGIDVRQRTPGLLIRC